jgi:hypothetical protein
MIKRALYRIGGVAAFIIPPLAHLSTKYEMFVAKEAGISLSAYGIVGIIAVLPLLGYYIRKIPFKVSFVGLAMLIGGLIGMYAGKTLATVGALVLGGGALGQIAFKRADVDKVKDGQEKLVDMITERLQESK